MWKKVKTRLRNPKVVTAVISGILMLLVNLDIIDVNLQGKILDGVNYILGLGITIGIFGNPDSHIKE
jgi:uncharacterized membrane protein